MRLNRTLSPTQLTILNPRCKKHELADNEEDGKKVWPLKVQCTQIARSISKGKSGNTWQDGDKQSKSEFSFLPFPCDFVEQLSEDSFQEDRIFELEFEIPVVCAPVVQQISVNGKLFKSIQHWRSLRALDFILSVIGNGYKILFISMPPPRRFTNLERLSWNSCVAILSRKSFLRRTLSIPALAVSVQVNGEKRLILD